MLHDLRFNLPEAMQRLGLCLFGLLWLSRFLGQERASSSFFCRVFSTMPLTRARWNGRSTTISTLEPPADSFTFILALNIEPSAVPVMAFSSNSHLYLLSNFFRSRSFDSIFEMRLKLSLVL